MRSLKKKLAATLSFVLGFSLIFSGKVIARAEENILADIEPGQTITLTVEQYEAIADSLANEDGLEWKVERHDASVNYNNLICTREEHVHSSETEEDCMGFEFICEQEEHTHSLDECYDLTCTAQEHTHDDSCYESELTCGMKEHTHSIMCLWGAMCGTKAHTHNDSCFTTSCVCGQEEHTHSIENGCYTFTCSAEEHTHSEYGGECYEQKTCEAEEHTHDDSCYEQIDAYYTLTLKTADGASEVGDGDITVAVIVNDNHGNAISGATVTINATDKKVFSMFNTTRDFTATTNSDGQVTFKLPGSYDVVNTIDVSATGYTFNDNQGAKSWGVNLAATDWFEWLGWFNGVGTTLTLNANTFSVDFVDIDGEKICNTQSVEYGQQAFPPVAPEVEGKTFKNWSTNYKYITGDTTVQAVYEDNTYLVRYFDKDGVQIGEDQNIAYGEAALEETAPEVDDMTFIGWKEMNTGADVDLTDIRAAVDVQATYSDDDVYTVTFNTLTGSEIKTFNATKKNNICDMPEGKTIKVNGITAEFVSWTPAGDYDFDENGKLEVNQNMVFNAEYGKKTIEFVFYTQIEGAEINDETTSTVTVGQEVVFFAKLGTASADVTEIVNDKDIKGIRRLKALFQWNNTTDGKDLVPGSENYKSVDTILAGLGVTAPELGKEGFAVDWYVIKYESSDGWHVDGEVYELDVEDDIIEEDDEEDDIPSNDDPTNDDRRNDDPSNDNSDDDPDVVTPVINDDPDEVAGDPVSYNDNDDDTDNEEDNVPVSEDEKTEDEIVIDTVETPEGTPTEEEPAEEIKVDVIETPEGAPEEEDKVELEVIETPQGDVLPQTGVASAAVFYGLGAACIIFGGVTLKKVNRKEEQE